MNFQNKRDLQNKARALYGLAEALKCDAFVLRQNAGDCDIDKIEETMLFLDETIGKILHVMNRIEVLINLD